LNIYESLKPAILKSKLKVFISRGQKTPKVQNEERTDH